MGSNIGFSIYSNDRRFPFWTCLCKKVSAIKGNYRINNSAETMQIMAKIKAVAGVWEMLGQLIPKISSSGFFPWHFPSTIGVQFHPSMAYLYFGKNQTRGDLHWEEEQETTKWGPQKAPTVPSRMISHRIFHHCTNENSETPLHLHDLPKIIL